MTTHKTFKSAFKKIESVIDTSRRQALNRAAASTRTLYAKEMVAIGIPSARAKARAKIIKATKSDTSVSLSIGTRVKFAEQDFNPGEQKVLTRIGPRYAATYKPKGQGRVIDNDGAFLAIGKNSGKKIIIKRKGISRYPTTTVLLDIFLSAVEKIKDKLGQYMVERFDVEYDHAIDYNMTKDTPQE